MSTRQNKLSKSNQKSHCKFVYRNQRKDNGLDFDKQKTNSFKALKL